MSDEFSYVWLKVNQVYVDLFHNLKHSQAFTADCAEVKDPEHTEKSEPLAQKYRENGNEIVHQQNDFKGAMEMYNKSLCYADDVQLGLAYANRALCFLGLEMYHECLTDIELAEKANYPVSQMPKLEQRKLMCLSRIQNSIKPTPLEPQMSFEEDKDMPGVAKVLTIKRSTAFGRYFMAQCDIKEDKVVLIEKPLVKLFNGDNKYDRCHSCLQKNTNLIPCGGCTKALFCDGPCANNEYHQYECNMKYVKYFEGKIGLSMQNSVKFLIRAVFLGLETSSSAEDLMAFVETFRSCSSRNDIVLNDGTTHSMLGIFFTHTNPIPYKIGQAKVLILASIAFDIIMARSDLGGKFHTLETQRFLMHYLTHLAAMFTANNILLQTWSDKWFDLIESDGKETFGVGLFNLSTYFNHDCMPNAVRLTTSDHVVIKTIRPIKKGEQIFVRYGINPKWSTPQRRQFLHNLCAFHCQCQLCSVNGPIFNEMSIVTSEFDILSMEMGPLIFCSLKNVNKWKSIKDKLFVFVKKYDDMPKTKSIILAYEYLRMVLARDLSCSTSY